MFQHYFKLFVYCQARKSVTFLKYLVDCEVFDFINPNKNIIINKSFDYLDYQFIVEFLQAI